MAFEKINLKTSKYLLRPLENTDLENVYIGLSHPEVIRYYGVSYKSLEETKEQMEFYKRLMEHETGMYWAVCDLNNTLFYGVGGVNNLSLGHRKAEIGYWLLPEYWNQGIMTETIPHLCHFAFEQWNLHRIEGFVETDNLACKRAMEKQGFTHEGTMVDCEVKNGSFISLDIYALLRKG
jgi:[ribosomal protein S5]-alanine N-acetyltransferase